MSANNCFTLRLNHCVTQCHLHARAQDRRCLAASHQIVRPITAQQTSPISAPMVTYNPGSPRRRIRTSKGTFLQREHDEVVAGVERRIARFSKIPAENGEALQILHYGSHPPLSLPPLDRCPPPPPLPSLPSPIRACKTPRLVPLCSAALPAFCIQRSDGRAAGCWPLARMSCMCCRKFQLS